MRGVKALLNQAIPGFPRRQVQIPPHAQAIPLESRHQKLGPIAILMGITDEDIGRRGACQCSRFNCPGLKYANSLPDHDKQAHKEAGREPSQRELDLAQRPLGPNLVRVVLALLQEILKMARAFTLSIDEQRTGNQASFRSKAAAKCDAFTRGRQLEGKSFEKEQVSAQRQGRAKNQEADCQATLGLRGNRGPELEDE